MTKGRTEKQRLLLIGYRAYGDWLYTAPVLPYLFEKYDVVLETNNKGYEIFHDDPRFAEIRMFDMDKAAKENPEGYDKDIFRRWAETKREVKADKVINLWRTLETKCIAERYQKVFLKDKEARREKFGKMNFYEAIFDKCEIPMPEKLETDVLHFTEEQEAWGKRWRKKHETDFVVLMPLAGSCSHKVYPDMPELSQRILDTYPNAWIYLMGDASVAHAQWEHPRIVHTAGKLPFKQAITMAKYADYVIGGETGLLVAAGTYGTHKTMLCTASSVYQCCKYHENDHSLQANIECSPCHRAVFATCDCEDMIHDGEETYHPHCIETFDMNTILGIVEEVYNKRNIYNIDYYKRFVERGESEVGKAIYDSRWEIIEKHCHGKLNLLDYGCASGAFHKSSRNGFSTYGFDVNPYSGFTKMPDAKVDILTMWDVIEHLHEPERVIRQVNPEYLFLSTPNVDDVKGPLENWRHYRPGEHLHYFSPKSIEIFLGECGYDVIDSNYDEGAIRDPENPKAIVTVAARRRSGNNSKFSV